MSEQLIVFFSLAISYKIVFFVIPKIINVLRIKKLFNVAILLIFLLCYRSALADNVITGGVHMKINSGIFVTMVQQVVVENGSTLTNEGTLILKDHLANQNLVAHLGKGTLEFSGTTVQNISGQNTLGKLVVNNPQGLNLLGNTTVNNELSLLNGMIRLGANNLTLGNQAILSGTPSASAMVVATGTGELRKSFSGIGKFTFPVGDESGKGEYTPVTVNFTNGSFGSENYVGVTLKPSAFPGFFDNGLNRYWSITQNGISDYRYDVLFQYVPTDNNDKEDELVAVKVEPDSVKTYNPSNTSLHQLSASGLNSFGNFTGIRKQKVGTEPNREIAQFRCFPNPFTDEITIEIRNSKDVEMNVEIYNLTGQCIKHLYKGKNNESLELKWDATNESGQHIAPGVYLVKVNGQSKELIFEGNNK